MSVEIFSIIFVLLICFLIFLKIRSYYLLTNHRGIGYVQKGFLCFSFAYFISLLQIILFLNQIRPQFGFPFFFTLFGVFQLLGFSYLISSMYHKDIEEWIILLSAPLITVIGIILHNRELVIFYSLLLVFALGYISYKKYKTNKSHHKKMFSQMYVVYLLIFLSWIIQIMSRIIIDMAIISKSVQIISSILIFSYIFYIIFVKIPHLSEKRELKHHKE